MPHVGSTQSKGDANRGTRRNFMPLGISDQTYIDRLADKVVKNLRPKDDKDRGEFLLHLYDALWENMRSKENRLWTFLSIYGAAVGLLFVRGQASQVAGAELFA